MENQYQENLHQKKFCTHCGTKLEIGDNFCTNCGNPQQEPPKPSVKKIDGILQKVNKKAVLGGIAIIILVCIYIYFNTSPFDKLKGNWHPAAEDYYMKFEDMGQQKMDIIWVSNGEVVRTIHATVSSYGRNDIDLTMKDSYGKEGTIVLHFTDSSHISVRKKDSQDPGDVLILEKTNQAQ